jgi:hypothetical protein
LFSRIQRLIKKIDRFGEENISDMDMEENSDGIILSKRTGMNKWLSSIEQIGSSAIDVMKSYISNNSMTPPRREDTMTNKIPSIDEENKSVEDKTESTAGMSNTDPDEINI